MGYKKLTSKKQDAAISSFLKFDAQKGKTFTCWDIHTQVFTEGAIPITSVRRSLNTLQNEGVVNKIGEKVLSGPYNTLCEVWKLTV